jgi:hypothetical protein
MLLNRTVRSMKLNRRCGEISCFREQGKFGFRLRIQDKVLHRLQRYYCVRVGTGLGARTTGIFS